MLVNTALCLFVLSTMATTAFGKCEHYMTKWAAERRFVEVNKRVDHQAQEIAAIKQKLEDQAKEIEDQAKVNECQAKEIEDQAKVNENQTKEIEDQAKVKEDQTKEIEELQKRAGEAIHFSATLSHSETLTQEGQVLVFDNVITNVGDDYNNQNGQFTCSVNGYYDFSYSVLNQKNKVVRLGLFVNNRNVNSIAMDADAGYNSATNSASLKLEKGDVVTVAVIYTNLGLSHVYGSSVWHYTTFTGNLLGALWNPKQ